MRTGLFITLILVAASVVSGCGSDGSGSIEIKALDLQDSTLKVGEGTVLFVDFSFDSPDLFDGDEEVNIVVKLPNGIEYRVDTSEIDGIGDDDPVGAEVLECRDTGESFLLYRLDRFDLDNASDPSGGADARLKLTIDGIKSTPTTMIAARASNDFFAFDCDRNFSADLETDVTVEG